MASLFASQVSSIQLLTFLLFIVCPSWILAWTCENSCEGVPLNYPFGSGWNCGNPSFQPYVNCSHGKLRFYTPTGIYSVQTIDYVNNVMIVIDPRMSTCNSIQQSESFGLPIGAPFSFAPYDTVALLGCSSISSLYNKQSCDISSQEVCQSLYSSCPGISQLEISANSTTSSCCVYSNSLLSTAPYEIDLPLLECASYSSIYQIGSIQTPQSSWLYGIALQFSQSQSSTNGQHPTCYVCQEAEESRGSFGAAPLGALWTAGLAMFVKGSLMLL